MFGLNKRLKEELEYRKKLEEHRLEILDMCERSLWPDSPLMKCMTLIEKTNLSKEETDE